MVQYTHLLSIDDLTSVEKGAIQNDISSLYAIIQALPGTDVKIVEVNIPPPPPPPANDFIPPPPPIGPPSDDFIPPPPKQQGQGQTQEGKSIPPPTGIKVVKPPGESEEDKEDNDGDDDDEGASIKNSQKKGHKSFVVKGDQEPLEVSKKHKSKSAKTIEVVAPKRQTMSDNPAREKIMDDALMTPDRTVYLYELYNDYLVVKMDPEVK